MICQNCGENEANVSYTQIINGNKKEMHLCEKCYHELGLKSLDFNMPLDFSSMFGEFLNEYNSEEFIPMIKAPKILKCDKCSMTYDEFLNTGKFGCDKCYEVFSKKINPLLKRIHGSDKYLGRKSKIKKSTEQVKIDKVVNKSDDTNKIKELQQNLQKCIKDENYEEAAKIRDEIKKIEKK